MKSLRTLSVIVLSVLLVMGSGLVAGCSGSEPDEAGNVEQSSSAAINDATYPKCGGPAVFSGANYRWVYCPSGSGDIPVFRSTQGGKTWESLGNAMSGSTRGALECPTSYRWAPTISQRPSDGKFVLMFAARPKVNGVCAPTNKQCIFSAVSDSLEGPFVSTSRVLCNTTVDGVNYIDPDIFVGDLGAHRYLAYKSLDELWYAELDATMTDVVAGTTVHLLSPPPTSNTWIWNQAARSLGDTPNVIENPAVFRHPKTNQWVLFFSGNAFRGPRYGTGVATCGSGRTPSADCTILHPEPGGALTDMETFDGIDWTALASADTYIRDGEIYAVSSAYAGSCTYPNCPSARGSRRLRVVHVWSGLQRYNPYQ